MWIASTVASGGFHGDGLVMSPPCLIMSVEIGAVLYIGVSYSSSEL